MHKESMMTRYRTKQALPVAAGTIVQLSEAQARDRKGRVVDLGEGRYQLAELLTFKAGEVLGIEGELPKVHQGLVDVVAGAEGAADLVPMAAKPKDSMGGRQAAKRG